MSEATLKARPRAWRLQFSLRLLLVAFTAFAIGFPIWYRWPYQETIEQRDPATGKLWSTRTITWQRQWGGERLAHGPESITTGDITRTAQYVLGNRHGGYTLHDAKGRMSETGQFVNDMKEGRWVAKNHWTSRSGEGWRIVVTSWHHDLLDGECEFSSGPKYAEKTVAKFSAGRLVAYNGKAIEDATFETLRKRQIDERIAAELQKETNVDFVEQPLKDVMMYIGDLHKIPTVVDRMGGFDVDLPITETVRGLNLQSALVLITAPHGLACDYRYGSLWITKADTARDWRDPTGISEIKPPAGSALARAWNEPVAADFLKAPLAEAMAFIEQVMAVSIDASRVHATSQGPVLVSAAIRARPLRHALGEMLYNSGCRCELKGDTLVILPPEEN